MSTPLPALRAELDLMPSPVADKPGLLVRDPYQYTGVVLILPPLLARMLPLFDGEHDELDLKAELSRATGEADVGDIAQRMAEALDQHGFLQTPTYFDLRESKHRAFAEADERAPAHAGSAYPDQPAALTGALSDYGLPSSGHTASPGDPSGVDADLLAIAAPHVSPEGGYRSYAEAYRRLQPEHASKTFIILGTSHYGQPERYGLTRKPYQTPLGAVETDQAIVDRLAKAAPDSVEIEDYCHATEHSIEFQTVFLQHTLGQGGHGALPAGEPLRAVPILCGAMAESLHTSRAPESNDHVRRFIGALAELAAERDDLIWVLGVDMAHIGRRYGDSFDAQAGEGRLEEVRRRDHERLTAVLAGDPEAFFELVKPNGDDLRWCGYSPIYTFLKACQGFRGNLLSYEQWNIDDQSVVSFVGAEFRKLSR